MGVTLSESPSLPRSAQFAKSCTAKAAEWRRRVEELQEDIRDAQKEIAQLEAALACPHKRLEIQSGFMCTSISCRDCGRELESDL
jgi:hypothetical protein